MKTASVDILKHPQVLRQIFKFSQAKHIRLYIVGGFLRDIIIGRRQANPDIDFALRRNAIGFASKLAKRLCAGFVVLDKDNGCARLVKKNHNGIYTLDFTDFRGRNLLQDLGKRDFSINALAIDMQALVKDLGRLKGPRYVGLDLIDPYQGMRDLKSGVIRAIDPFVFDDDPLRILRTFSLSCVLDFKIAPKTLALVKKKKNKLSRVSFERIRDELFKILASPRGYEFLAKLDRERILELIIPQIKPMCRLNQGPYHHLDVWKHTLETVKQLEKILKNTSRNQEINDYLNQEISSGRKRYELIKLGALLHDVGKPRTLRIEKGKVMFHGHERVGAEIFEDISRRLKLSNDETSVISKMIRFHLRPGYLADNKALTQRARFRFFRDAGNEAVSVLLISLADQRATKGYLTTHQSRRRHERVVRRLIQEYFQKKKEKKAVRLINGNDLIKRFKLEPSPLIGRILAEIEELQAIGRIKTKQQGLSAAKKLINSQLRAGRRVLRR